ncbi:hypothetical protein ACWGI8_29880 [Streptomyces sp. NPDC054841]
MPGFATRGKVRLAVALTVLAALVAGGLPVALAVLHDRQLSDNRAQLERACAGLLPVAELGRFLPDDSAGVLTEYGTLLDPDQDSRALLDCRLSWGGGPEKWEPDAEVRVRGEALLAPVTEVPGERVGEFPFRLPPNAQGSLHLDDRLDGAEAIASLLLDCPKGLPGRVRPSRDLHVEVGFPADGEHELTEQERLLVAGTAVDVANRIAERHHCGTARLTTDRWTPPDGPSLCAWLDTEVLRIEGFAETDGWDGSNNPRYSTRSGVCESHWTGSGRDPGHAEIKAVKAESGSALMPPEPVGASAPRPGSPGPWNGQTDSRGNALIPNEDLDVEVWARSICDGGRSDHRISVTPHLVFGVGHTATLTLAERRQISRAARAVLDRYLAAPDGWPKKAHCRDTDILGEVW